VLFVYCLIGVPLPPGENPFAVNNNNNNNNKIIYLRLTAGVHRSITRIQVSGHKA
jgi:hypothetical protein